MPTQTALITGASSGIGKEFALALAARGGWNLILVSRDTQRLAPVCEDIRNLWQNDPTLVLKTETADLTIESQRDHLIQRNPTIDLLINNAGVGFGFSALATLDQTSANATTGMIDLHCAAPAHLCRLVLPGMLSRSKGSIINVCSRRALAPMPYLACYAATKSFLLYFSVALASEMRPRGIRVLALCPGSTHTKGNNNRKAASATSVVTQALAALDKNKTIYITGLANRLVFNALRLLPMTWSAAFQGWHANATRPR